MAILIRRGTILNPATQMNEIADVLIEGDTISKIEPAIQLDNMEDVEVIDALGCFVAPGFIDLHVHGGGGSDVMDGDPESILQVARAHCQHGTTALTPTTMTCADDLLEKVIRSYRKAKAVGSDGAELLGLHLEGPFFAAAGKSLPQRVVKRRRRML